RAQQYCPEPVDSLGLFFTVSVCNESTKNFITWKPAVIESSLYLLQGLPNFLIFFVSAIVLLLLFKVTYSWLTPHAEMALIRANNTAAAMAFGGAIIGFALPLASAISQSVTFLDFVLWGLV